MRRLLIVCGLFAAFMQVKPCIGRGQNPVSIIIETAHPAAKVVPSEAIGAAIDGQQKGESSLIYNPGSLKEISSIPFHRLAYRLRTELGGEVWHWNPEGSWSDEANHQGYWTSSGKPGKPILVSYGYRLPRRGNTHDQANHDGYSRISDGDEQSFWKSNPYLDAHFTGIDNALNPQWVLINFEKKVNIQALRILWSEPFATDYEAEYWEGEPAEVYKDMLNGRWRTFPNGKITGGRGGDELLRLSSTPIRTPYLRILLKKGSMTAPAGSTDIRDRLGFAIRELYAGGLSAKGEIIDRVVHAADGKSQTKLLTSSADPWHRASDIDEKIEQPGVDLLMQSGLTHGKPVLMPAGLLYDTPQNAASEVRYMKQRVYDVRQIELGEEPDGQYVSPEHYGELFVQFADAIHREDASVVLGGPGFQSEVDGWNSIPDHAGDRSWMKRFLAYLRERNRSGDFGFFSFEWYPFDDLCEDEPSAQLVEHPALIRQTLRRLAEDGVPRNIPWIITEYGYSSYAGQREVELPAALLNAEILAQYLMAGISALYLYGIEPNDPIQEVRACQSWGNLMTLQKGPDGNAKWRLPTYYGASLTGGEWLGPPDGVHTLYPVRVAGRGASDPSIAAYAVYRPDEQWALLVLNKSAGRGSDAEISFDNGKSSHEWLGPTEVLQYSDRQYNWVPAREDGHPGLSEPPSKTLTAKDVPLRLNLPPMSITVVRGGAGQSASTGALGGGAARSSSGNVDLLQQTAPGEAPVQ
ncbi:MAG: discoidin domain-containing protein [Rhodomicrobium sp.]